MIIKCFLVFLFLSYSILIVAQQTFGTFIYERRTNLRKLKQWNFSTYKEAVEESPTITETFRLQFNDTCSYYDYEENQSNKNDWMTTKTAYFISNKVSKRIVKFDFWGEEIIIQDTVTPIQWKITSNKRTIMEYECIKAIWQKNDSTRIYAWFSPMISASIGPEGISGLPGAILGLAREDGSVVYFANRFTNEFDAKYIRKEIKSSKSVTKWMFFKQLAVNFSSFEWGRVFLAELERWY